MHCLCELHLSKTVPKLEKKIVVGSRKWDILNFNQIFYTMLLSLHLTNILLTQDFLFLVSLNLTEWYY